MRKAVRADYGCGAARVRAARHHACCTAARRDSVGTAVTTDREVEMRRVHAGLLVVLCMLVGATAAFAATTKTVKSSGKFQVASLGQNSAGQNVFAGQVVDKKYGKGAVVLANKVSGDTLAGPFKVFFDNGTL